MTKITICKNKNGQACGVEFIGHAEYATAGKDIVCAGISTIAQFTELQLEYMGIEIKKLKTSGALFLCLSLDDNEGIEATKPLFRALQKAITSLVEQYPRNVSLAIKILDMPEPIMVEP